ncbi:hypothetical protein UVI_02012160 [Ustilaginoidea virens]|uniref:Uncharacterized protein n=1 Tax=Ustilaginoidea virens TaxID=1159556 RepID=A0A1B5L4W9_USTVR|nr:hypothetical protein UVI_02012160 [Ustilaginoidea virens]
MSGTASTSVSCSVGDDVLECANKVYKNIQVSSDAVSGSHSAVNIRVSINDLYTGFVDVAWDTKLSECVVTPEVVYEGEGVFCNSKIGATVSPQQPLKVVASPVTPEFNENWTKSVAAESTVERRMRLEAGQVCFPSTVQLRVDCQQTITVKPAGNPPYMVTYYIAMPPQLGQFPMSDICKHYKPGSGTDSSYVTSDDLSKLCDTKASKVSFYATLQDGNPWSMEGCMRS